MGTKTNYGNERVKAVAKVNMQIQKKVKFSIHKPKTHDFDIV